MITLQVMTSQDAEKIRQWRNKCLDTLRTPFPLTVEQQQEWYHSVVTDRKATARWYSVYRDSDLIGYTGIENISWINRIGEISLLINPAEHGRGYGKQAVELILDIGFNTLNLNCIFGECYVSNSAKDFWKKLVDRHKGEWTILLGRKYLNGKYVASMYFSIMKEEYENSLLHTGKGRE